jgi:hypothetical protein
MVTADYSAAAEQHTGINWQWRKQDDGDDGDQPYALLYANTAARQMEVSSLAGNLQ